MSVGPFCYLVPVVTFLLIQKEQFKHMELLDTMMISGMLAITNKLLFYFINVPSYCVLRIKLYIIES